ncbi:DUF402 domain-containing protein [Pyrobaculum calidifontis]|uniref:Probable ribonuclease FAU-1 n=1 Tax=Pyrobaculum calidifontis (strain DSM 21063 / JCM 11548 / VA1) TaxID=410359 RepID=FAU1_PYRCJ|nr:DUF402 domain-containing protein [Pyrobaculum calidifontis]A3MXT8.1 RecName: Full=Probable ribonuclease FAU-1; AltName: Full=RNA-binding protein FAU-1 [Pyrobaculum calidifontis JCM 11548]ABO09455.1 RNA-binding protein AU-1 [Pyrobaculum calidifontis JCM 11548]
MKVRIRGIFATALTKLALDWGFSIVQPTGKIVERFDLPVDNSPPDVTVIDHESKSGVVVLGKCGAVEAFVERLREAVDPVVVKADLGVHDVFVGKVVGEGRVEGPGGIVLRVPPRFAPTVGSVGVFTVVRPPLGPVEGVAVPDIIVEGDYVELSTSPGVRFSRHIPEGERVRLRLLAETRLGWLGGLGVRFKSSARFAEDEAVVREAEALYRELVELAKGGEAGAVLRRGRCLALALFDKAAKERLDEVRRSVVPTARGHHALRAQGLGKCLDLLDYLGVEAYERAAEFLARGAVEIWHIKPWGEMVKMRGEAVGVFGDWLVVKRPLRPGGVLDGIGVKIERGFYALTCVPRRGNYVVHTYYTPEGRAVGTYINVNSEPEWGRRIIYIDLLVDVAYVGGEAKVLDLEEYRRYEDVFPARLRPPSGVLSPPVACGERGIIEAPPQSASS